MSDNYLIRRADALEVAEAEMRRYGFGLPGGRGDQICAAINTIPAVQPTVKPLVWVDIQHGRYYEARAIGFRYLVVLGSDGLARWQDGYMGRWNEAENMEAAKAAAQADYEARIRSALTVTATGKEVMPNDDGNSNARPEIGPGVTAGASPDVAALVEAAEKVINSYWNSTDGVITGIYDLEAALARVKGVV